MSSSPLFRGRHYAWLSSHFRDQTRKLKESLYSLPTDYDNYHQFVLELIHSLSNENPNFNPEQFLINSDLSYLVEFLPGEERRDG